MQLILRFHILPIIALALLGSLDAVRSSYASVSNSVHAVDKKHEDAAEKQQCAPSSSDSNGINRQNLNLFGLLLDRIKGQSAASIFLDACTAIHFNELGRRSSGRAAGILFENRIERIRRAYGGKTPTLPEGQQQFTGTGRISLYDVKKSIFPLRRWDFDSVFLSIEDRKTLRKKE